MRKMTISIFILTLVIVGTPLIAAEINEEKIASVLQNQGYSPKNIYLNNPDNPVAYFAIWPFEILDLFTENENLDVYELYFDQKVGIKTLTFNCYALVSEENKIYIQNCEIGPNSDHIRGAIATGHIFQ